VRHAFVVGANGEVGEQLTEPYVGETLHHLWDVELAVFTFLATGDISKLYEPGVYMWVYNHCAGKWCAHLTQQCMLVQPAT